MKNNSQEPGENLNTSEQKTLLNVARQTLTTYIGQNRRPDLYTGDFEITDKMKVICGVFVSLHKNHELRGCIGHIVGRMPMVESVCDNAINAAVSDYRFPPVTMDEIPAIKIEISVLSPMAPVASIEDIKLGVHGVLLKLGGSQAVFLPQVAPEQGWDLEETLQHLARKAGLRSNGWRHPETEYSVFTAQVFGEME